MSTKNENVPTKAMWKALFSKLTKISTSLGNTRIRVFPIKEEENEIGYTTKERNIYLTTNHELFNGLSMGEIIKFIKGVWTHEMMHQLLTDFSSTRILRQDDIVVNDVYHTIFNIVEDSRIENLAPNYIGGLYTEDKFDNRGKLVEMSDLTFSKRVIYRNFSGIDAPASNGLLPSPYCQFINALISYGDCGIIKGRFISKEAQKIFIDVLPIFDETIEETNFRIVVKNSIKIAEMSRPLWEEDRKAVEEMNKLLKELRKNKHDSGNRSLSTGESSSSSGNSSKSLASKRREVTRKKISAAEVNEMLENGEISEETDDEDFDTEEILEIEDPENLSSDANDYLVKHSKTGSKSVEGEYFKSQEESTKETNDSEDTGSSDFDESEDEGLDDELENDESSSNETNSEDLNEKATDEFDKTSDSSETESANSEPEREDDEASDIKLDKGRGEEKADDNDDEKSTYSNSNAKLGDIAENGKMPDDDYYNNASDNDSLSDEDKEFLDDTDDYIVPASELNSILSEIDRYVKADEREKKRLEDSSMPENIQITSRYFKNASVINRNVKVVDTEADSLSTSYTNGNISISSSYDEYNEIKKNIRRSLNGAITQFKRLFKNKPDERVHKSHGRINIERMHSGTITSRVFDKIKTGRNPNDMAIFLLLDESGSMSCSNRYIYSRLAAIGFAEMCEALSIPIYIMGFTADECEDGGYYGRNTYDAVHLHYIKWKNNKKTRLNLLAIKSRANNFDGYSIRYATKILSKRPETNKILITISDGCPACSKYNSENGLADAKLAIKEANRSCIALGVAIGDGIDNAKIKEIYGENYLEVKDVSSLFQQLSGKLRKMIKENF